MDPLVKIINVRHVPGFNIGTLTPTSETVVTFTVGAHGPFNLTYSADKYNEAQVQQDIQRQVDSLRTLGALS